MRVTVTQLSTQKPPRFGPSTALTVAFSRGLLRRAVLERQVLLATGRTALPVFRGQRIPYNAKICYQPPYLSSQRCCPIPADF